MLLWVCVCVCVFRPKIHQFANFCHLMSKITLPYLYCRGSKCFIIISPAAEKIMKMQNKWMKLIVTFFASL